MPGYGQTGNTNTTLSGTQVFNGVNQGANQPGPALQTPPFPPWAKGPILGQLNTTKAPAPAAPFTSVQANSVQGASGTTVTITLPAGVTQGNLLIATVTFGGIDSAISGPAGWALDAANVSSGSNTIQTNIFRLLVGSSQAGQVSWQFSATTSHTWYVTIREWSAANGWAANPLDKTAVGQTGAATATVIVSGTTAATASSNQLQVASLAYKGSAQAESGVSAGWTNGIEVTLAANNTTRELYNTANAAGAASCQFTIGVAAYWAGAIATYQTADAVTSLDATATPAVITLNAAFDQPAISAGSISPYTVAASNSVTLSTSQPFPVSQGTSTGDTIVAWVNASATAINGLADSKGNSYTPALSYVSSPRLSCFYCVNATPLTTSDTFTVSLSGTTGGASLIARACAGVTAIDVAPAAAFGTSTSPSCASGVLAQASEWLIGAIANTSTGGQPSAISGGFNLDSAQHAGSTQWLTVADQVVNSTASVSLGATIVSTSWSCAVVSFKIGGSVVNATAAPAVIVASALLGVAPASADSTATPGVILAVTAIGAATASAGSIPAPLAVPVVSLISAPVPTASSRAPPGALSVSAAIPAPSASASAAISVNAVQVSASVPVPGVTNGGSATATPAVVSASASITAPQLSASANATPASLSAATSTPAPGASASSKALPSSASLASSIASPGASASSKALPSSASLATSIPAPGLATTGLAAPAALSASATIPAPSVSAGGSATASPATVAASASIPAPSPNAGSKSAPAGIAAQATLSAPVCRAGAVASPSAVNVSASITAPSVSGSAGALATPSTVLAITSVPTSPASVSVTARPSVVAGASSIPSPAARIGATVQAQTIQASAQVGLPYIPSQFGYGTSSVGSAELNSSAGSADAAPMSVDTGAMPDSEPSASAAHSDVSGLIIGSNADVL